MLMRRSRSGKNPLQPRCRSSETNDLRTIDGSARGLPALASVLFVARSNAETLRRIIDAFNRDAVEEIGDYCDPEVTYTIRGHGPLGATYSGVTAFAGALRAMRDLTASTVTVVPQVLLEGEDAIMAYMRVSASRPDGRTLDSHNAYLYRFREGRLLEGQTIPVDQAAFDAFTAD